LAKISNTIVKLVEFALEKYFPHFLLGKNKIHHDTTISRLTQGLFIYLFIYQFSKVFKNSIAFLLASISQKDIELISDNFVCSNDFYVLGQFCDVAKVAIDDMKF
jgi:hypothetical protein